MPGLPYQVPVHWLRPNHGETSPHRAVFFDSESYQDTIDGTEYHRLRYWHARFVRRHTVNPRKPVEVYATGTDQQSLATTIDNWSCTKQTLWVFAHNLSYDLTTTNVLDLLHKMGWELTDANINSRTPWVRIHKGRKRIIFTDSFSWIPAPLEKIGEWEGLPKIPVDNWTEATDEQIAERCERDVDILSRAMLRIMDWWDSEKMGRWSWSGPACGFAVFRHRFLTHKILMDPDPDRCAFERRAIYGGRREAYRTGGLGYGHYIDCDFKNAYATIAATTAVPWRSVGRLSNVDTTRHTQRPADLGIIAECVVTTTEPIVPAKHGHSTVFPVGTFSTVLTSIDIDALVARGMHVEIGRAVVYKLAPALRDWGQWVVESIDLPADSLPGVLRCMIKHWSRTVIGRWAMHGTRREDWGVACYPWFHMETGRTFPANTPTETIHAFGQHIRLHHDIEPQNGFPAITAWIEASCRQLLYSAIEKAGTQNVLQCDTDGFLIGHPGCDAIERRAAHGNTEITWSMDTGECSLLKAPSNAGPLKIRIKGVYRNALVKGPQQLKLDKERRMSGVPRSLIEYEPLKFIGNLWPGLQWQMANSKPGIYTRPECKLSIRGPYGNRWQLQSGFTVPPEMIIADGVNRLVKPEESSHISEADPLHRDQPAILYRTL